MKYSEAIKLVGGLSNPSKMPWYGWSISARDCNTGGKLRQIEDSVCSSCYAMKGFYNMPGVKTAHARRKAALNHPKFVDAMVVVLNHLQKFKKNEDRFRWHDSGDLQDLKHLQKIVAIAERTPTIRHYLPTKEKGIVKRFKGKIPDNLFIKISSPLIGSKVDPKIDGVDYTTVDYAGPEVFQCPALHRQNNQCLACDACWKRGNVNYPLH